MTLTDVIIEEAKKELITEMKAKPSEFSKYVNLGLITTYSEIIRQKGYWNGVDPVEMVKRLFTMDLDFCDAFRNDVIKVVLSEQAKDHLVIKFYKNCISTSAVENVKMFESLHKSQENLLASLKELALWRDTILNENTDLFNRVSELEKSIKPNGIKRKTTTS